MDVQRLHLAAPYGALLVLVSAVAGAGLLSSAHACDTTIRQQAFVNKREPHRLAFAASAREGAAKADYERLQAWLAGPGANFNAKLEWVDASNPDLDWSLYGIPSPPPSLPVTILAGKDKTEGTRAFVIEHWEPSPSEKELKDLLDSPVRAALRRALCERWAVLLYSPGLSGAAESVIADTVKEWSKSYPPGIGVIRFDPSSPDEHLLAAFTGAEKETEWVGIAFGRGKLMSPPLAGNDIAQEALDGELQQVMEACSCLRPPERMGVDIPMLWEPELDDSIAVLQPPETPENAQAAAAAPPGIWLSVVAALAFAALVVFGATAWAVARQRKRSSR